MVPKNKMHIHITKVNVVGGWFQGEKMPRKEENVELEQNFLIKGNICKISTILVLHSFSFVM
jgi:hypothetical protein